MRVAFVATVAISLLFASSGWNPKEGGRHRSYSLGTHGKTPQRCGLRLCYSA